MKWNLAAGVHFFVRLGSICMHVYVYIYIYLFLYLSIYLSRVLGDTKDPKPFKPLILRSG